MFFFFFFFLQNITQSKVPNIEQFAIQQTVLEQTAVIVKYKFIKCKQSVDRRLNNIPDFEATLLKWGCQWNGNYPIKKRNIFVYKSYQKQKQNDLIWNTFSSIKKNI